MSSRSAGSGVAALNTDHIVYRIVAFSSRTRAALVCDSVMSSVPAQLCCRSAG
jgi:hypothetical protein